MIELREKMAAKRAIKEKESMKESKISENIRRKAGKVRRPFHDFPYLTSDSLQDMGKIKEDLQLKEANKEAAQKKRGSFHASIYPLG